MLEPLVLKFHNVIPIVSHHERRNSADFISMTVDPLQRVQFFPQYLILRILLLVFHKRYFRRRSVPSLRPGASFTSVVSANAPWYTGPECCFINNSKMFPRCRALPTSPVSESVTLLIFFCTALLFSVPSSPRIFLQNNLNLFKYTLRCSITAPFFEGSRKIASDQRPNSYIFRLFRTYWRSLPSDLTITISSI